ncbi:MAG: hypothetical protein HYT64_01265 [Candidatus Yanofskybacteria bacterium]|nr:hypothetical protein [Candidatus Yanofskybacteria bacterium]
MDRETFDRILKEEGIDDVNLRDEIWRSRPPDIREDDLRLAARRFAQELPSLKVRKALNEALDREYGRDKD